MSATLLKKIGSSGQIALGKRYAGRQAMVEEPEPGVWIVRLGRFVPDSEMWLQEPSTAEALDEAIRWAESHPPRETDLAALAKKIG
jgi:hypothetical protein